MFLKGESRGAVLSFLSDNNVVQDQAETLATNAYTAIRDARQEMLNQVEQEENSGGNGSLIFGVLLLVGGIAATMMTDRIWYGAMGVGVIVLFQGLAAKAK